MNKYRYILLIFISVLFCNSSCEHQEDRQRFIIQNNSDKEIIVLFSESNAMEHKDKFCIKKLMRLEYGDLIRYYMIEPNSHKNIGIRGIGDRILEQPMDTLSISAFYRVDMDAMSCEEFEQEFPLKKEWKVTLSDMQAADWTLIYTPED
jgi:hypothetical protein